MTEYEMFKSVRSGRIYTLIEKQKEIDSEGRDRYHMIFEYYPKDQGGGILEWWGFHDQDYPEFMGRLNNGTFEPKS